MDIRQAQRSDLDQLVVLFDAYRQFYGRSPDPAASRAFLEERMRRSESVIFVATSEGRCLGFTQLYPAFSSTACRRLWILNDLYVTEEARRSGVARALMDTARDYAVETGACGIQLETAHSNISAQRLYESLGYQVDEDFRVYELMI